MKRLYTLAAAILFPASSLVAAGVASGQDSLIVFPPGSGRVYAREDSLPDSLATGHVPTTVEIPVTATRVPLLEIIRKAREGERRKYEGLKTLAYNQSLKVIMTWGGKKPKTRCQEVIQRVYYRAPHDWTLVTIRDTTYVIDAQGNRGPKEKKDDIDIDLDTGRRKDWRQLTEIPFYLERLDRFRFHIAGKSLNKKQVLYEVDFTPLSDFDKLPGGKMWLLTPNYQIVREEFSMKNKPFPWIVKDLDLLAREWQEIDGRWVEKRITGRVDLGMIGGDLLKVPKRIEFVLNFDQYRFDPVLDDKIFSGGGR